MNTKNPIKTVLEKAKITQKEYCEKTKVRQSTMSHRMNNDVHGSIEWSIEVAKELNIRSYKIVGDGYEVRVRIK